jgi:hypothetical protein
MGDFEGVSSISAGSRRTTGSLAEVRSPSAREIGSGMLVVIFHAAPRRQTRPPWVQCWRLKDGGDQEAQRKAERVARGYGREARRRRVSYRIGGYSRVVARSSGRGNNAVRKCESEGSEKNKSNGSREAGLLLPRSSPVGLAC